MWTIITKIRVDESLMSQVNNKADLFVYHI